MKRRYNKKSIHHIMPRSRKDYNTGIDENKIMLNDVLHEKRHGLFINLTFRQQLGLLFKINNKILTEKTKKELIEIINKEDEEIYIDKLLK